MSDNAKRSVPRTELKKRIVETAMQAFKSHGIKSITMDDIAVSLGISKRTLYEVFANKEMLLEACILKEREDMKAYVDEMLATSDHVLEVLLKLYLHSIERFHATHKSFFEDLKKYRKSMNFSKATRNMIRQKLSVFSRRV